MVDVDGTFHISILIDHLVFIQDAADAVGPFPSRRQLEVRSGGVVRAKMRLPIW